MTKQPINIHQFYHAHVYFDERSIESARELCEQAGDLFDIRVGRVHEKPVGPHPCGSCQLSFDQSKFGSFIPWLEKNRCEFSVLVHGVTGDAHADHTKYAYWLGEEIPLTHTFSKN